MKITRRIKYYLIGFGIGIIASLIIFQGRGCEWLPNERVLNSIRTSNIYYNTNDSCLMAENNITKKDIFFLLEYGDVNFGESQPKLQNKHYTVNETTIESEYRNYTIEHDSLKISFDLFERDSIVFISKFHHLHNSTTCSNVPAVVTPLYMPNDMTLEKLRSNSYRFEKQFKCELECYDLSESDIDSAMISGNILFEKSYPNKRPNPLFFIEFKKENQSTVELETFFLMIEQGTTKTRFNRIAKLNDITNLDGSFQVEMLFREINCKCKD